jgi:hypothetical protein
MEAREKNTIYLLGANTEKSGEWTIRSSSWRAEGAHPAVLEMVDKDQNTHT